LGFDHTMLRMCDLVPFVVNFKVQQNRLIEFNDNYYMFVLQQSSFLLLLLLCLLCLLCIVFPV
jgi:hypothetical protein